MLAVRLGRKEVKKDYCASAGLSKATGNVHAAGCDCEACEGEACNHIASLMYGLIDITEKKKEGSNASTSKQFLWNQPRSRKLSPKKANEVVFKKQKFTDMNNTTIVSNVHVLIRNR
ncbi:hypothetical protein DPMN_126593 [Dreissena polymorpha]|uniref:SWIM-type domain-containing protein n=1 Tax=Dreissena polymorpha TaxID=45954 RepID=A0A9D4GXC3_DREPO|nr:hypothetical protein DPMN_126593 [Dreissena polymorpha]